MDENNYSRSSRRKEEEANFDEKGPRRPHRRRRTRWLGWTLLILLVAAIGVSAFFFAEFKSSVESMQHSAKITKARDVNQLVKEGKPFSVLVLGTDVGELNRDRDGLTDSMMILTVNPTKQEVTMTSIPRDIMVSIVGAEETFPQKMNAAYPIEGVGATMQTVQNYLNVPIDFYVLVNMKGLESLVDQVGGVSVDSPLDFQYSQETAHAEGPNLYRFHKGSSRYEHSDDNGKTWSKSKTVMDGDAALAFSRMRYDDPDGDYGRQLRQRLVLKALMKKAVNLKNLTNPKFIKTVSKNAQTDISFDNVLKLITTYRVATKNQVSDNLQGQLDMYGGISYQMVPKTEKQRITDKIRNQLALEPKDTGTQFGGQVPSYGARIASDNLALIGEQYLPNE
ncbi:LCP family protein [Convivina intestini]|uniref:LytR family transcriptional attenuator n=1 Tax=Convivina intestini TaxID=1505726 RepID=A0A2U1DBD8_9LACO|nr:LCP family protein [Convivina intestini]PVY84990.1 LytR family transcriptional attenuator [Convivina intestini]CAH1853330.1 Biofilm regulatory protein A [Convivina intestini]SDB89574.1 transcriptional attenuator, LytR family [Leuconostocaceae bacterium R-53105]